MKSTIEMLKWVVFIVIIIGSIKSISINIRINISSSSIAIIINIIIFPQIAIANSLYLFSLYLSFDSPGE